MQYDIAIILIFISKCSEARLKYHFSGWLCLTFDIFWHFYDNLLKKYVFGSMFTSCRCNQAPKKRWFPSHKPESRPLRSPPQPNIFSGYPPNLTPTDRAEILHGCSEKCMFPVCGLKRCVCGLYKELGRLEETLVTSSTG